MPTQRRAKNTSLSIKTPICLHLSVKLVPATPNCETTHMPLMSKEHKEATGRTSIGSKSTSYSRSEDSNKRIDDSTLASSLANYIKLKMSLLHRQEKCTRLKIMDHILSNPSMRTCTAGRIYHSNTSADASKTSFTFGCMDMRNMKPTNGNSMHRLDI